MKITEQRRAGVLEHVLRPKSQPNQVVSPAPIGLGQAIPPFFPALLVGVLALLEALV